MTNKHFIIKTLRKCIIFAVLMFVVVSLMQPSGVVISNSMALGQMQNSDEMYILMDTYNKIRPIASAAFAGVIIWFTCTIACDIYTFVKTKLENKKEN